MGTFEFSVRTPASTGTYNEYFSLVADGITWMNDPGMYWTFGVKAPTYSWQPTSQEMYTDSGRTDTANARILAPNTTYYMRVRARNTGNTTWNKGTVNLGTSNPRDRRSAFCDSSWLNGSSNCNRVSTLVENTVSPGALGTFEFRLRTPGTVREYNEYFSLVADGITWMNDPGMYWTLRL